MTSQPAPLTAISLISPDQGVLQACNNIVSINAKAGVLSTLSNNIKNAVAGFSSKHKTTAQVAALAKSEEDANSIAKLAQAAITLDSLAGKIYDEARFLRKFNSLMDDLGGMRQEKSAC